MLKILLTASRGHSLEVNTAPRLSEKLHPPSGPLCSACCEALVSLHEISPLLGFIYKWLWVQNSVCKNFAQKKTKPKQPLVFLSLLHMHMRRVGDPSASTDTKGKRQVELHTRWQQQEPDSLCSNAHCFVFHHLGLLIPRQKILGLF